jgi:hypothetical protein
LLIIVLTFSVECRKWSAGERNFLHFPDTSHLQSKTAYCFYINALLRAQWKQFFLFFLRITSMMNIDTKVVTVRRIVMNFLQKKCCKNNRIIICAGHIGQARVLLKITREFTRYDSGQ